MIIVNNRDKIDWKPGMTVQDVLEIMGYSYALITVFVNEKHVKKVDFKSCKLDDNSQVNVFHLAHGG